MATPRTGLSLALVFGLPFVALVAAFAALQLDWVPRGQPSAAVLLRGGQALHLDDLLAPGQSWRARGIEPPWLLITAQGPGCGGEQLRALDLALRIEAGLGRESVQVRRLHLALADAPPPPPEVVRDAALLRLRALSCPPLPAQVASAAAPAAAGDTAAGLWVADRDGRLTAWFPAAAQGADILRDLKKFVRTPPKPAG